MVGDYVYEETAWAHPGPALADFVSSVWGSEEASFRFRKLNFCSSGSESACGAPSLIGFARHRCPVAS